MDWKYYVLAWLACGPLSYGLFTAFLNARPYSIAAGRRATFHRAMSAVTGPSGVLVGLVYLLADLRSGRMRQWLAFRLLSPAEARVAISRTKGAWN